MGTKHLKTAELTTTKVMAEIILKNNNNRNNNDNNNNVTVGNLKSAFGNSKRFTT